MELRNLVLDFVHMEEHRHEEPGHREVVHAVVGLGVDILADKVDTVVENKLGLEGEHQLGDIRDIVPVADHTVVAEGHHREVGHPVFGRLPFCLRDP